LASPFWSTPDGYRVKPLALLPLQRRLLAGRVAERQLRVRQLLDGDVRVGFEAVAEDDLRRLALGVRDDEREVAVRHRDGTEADDERSEHAVHGFSFGFVGGCL
jgi:hypothetical protein